MRNIFRKLSIRSRSPPVLKKKSAVNALKKNSSGLLRFMRNGDKMDEEAFLFEMPIDVLLTVIDRMPFFEQIRMARLCKRVKAHLDEKFSKIKKLELRKRDINEACASDDSFERHSKAYVAIRIQEDTACLVIDDAWVVADFYVFLGMLNTFREGVETVEMDAPIAELIVISMSNISLERWYAFQCILKAFNDVYEDLHLDSGFIADRDTLWPRCSDIVIHATKAQASALGRILDYGVNSCNVFDRRTMDHLRLEFDDLKGFDDKAINKQIYYFRCWTGSLGWDHRYEIVFNGNSSKQECHV